MDFEQDVGDGRWDELYGGELEGRRCRGSEGERTAFVTDLCNKAVFF
jgi:hypothetical protein